ncbi:phage tail fiber protein [Serratia fonticola]|uniref:phage tail fiber protein n=1 Tax=Serratia fonticola TaxID=47917 RepID=UPI00217903E0|nr:hypothetical protein [Serratia fonticola]CAI1860506.1 Uncharacterised protein [Serratia fonticola]
MWYKTGAINLTANNATVTGTGTAWADAKFGVMPGMILLAPDNKLYEVKQVNSNTSLTLNSNYAGTTASGQSYAIITTYEGDISQFSARFAAMLTFFQGSRNDTVSWFTGSGDMTFTKDDGTKLTVPTLAKIQSDYLSRSSTANQHVAGSVSFSLPMGMSLSTSQGFLPRTQGAWVGWNRATGATGGATNATDFVNHKGSGSGGFNFWNSDGATADRVITIGSSGNILQRATAAGNTALVHNFYASDDSVKASFSSNTVDGSLSIKWNGTSYSMNLRSDGTITIPNTLYIGATPVLKSGEYGIGGITPLLNPATVMEEVKKKPTGKYAVNSGSTDMPRDDVAYYLDWSMTAASSGGHGFLLASALADKGSAQEGLYKNTLRSGSWQGWLKVTMDNSMAQIIAPTMKSWGGSAGYVKLAEYGPTATGASGILFSVSNGQGYGTPGIDHKLVYFSTRGASSTALTPRGLQVLSFGLNYVENVNLVFGTLYNSTTGKWELWMKGPGYNVPSIQILGNVSGTAILAGITYNNESSWQTAMPAGLTFVTETKALSGFNTTVDSNGFIKAASPIVKLFGDGVSELNDESLGITTERVSQGVYHVSGVRGFNADATWGGAGNGIEIPVDDNKRPLVWIESKVLPDGDIEIRTYHRSYDTGPYSTRNIEAMDSGEIDDKKQPIFVEMPDGTPIDIPEGRFIDLRVEMPATDDPEPVF